MNAIFSFVFSFVFFTVAIVPCMVMAQSTKAQATKTQAINICMDNRFGFDVYELCDFDLFGDCRSWNEDNKGLLYTFNNGCYNWDVGVVLKTSKQLKDAWLQMWWEMETLIINVCAMDDTHPWCYDGEGLRGYGRKRWLERTLETVHQRVSW